MAIIKHANPCGIAISAESVADAHRKAHECDPLSAFGGVIATNTTVSVAMAETVADIFTEVIIAPAFEAGAVDILARKKNIRVLVAPEPQPGGAEFRQISGGLLVQTRDALDAAGDDPINWTLATGEPADPATLSDLVFAWRTCRAVKSNAIVVARDGATVGVGMGQVNRVDAARLAVERPRLSEAFRIVAGSLLRVVAPMLAGMAVAAADFLAVMAWWRWAPILPIFYCLLGYALVRPLMDDAGGLLAAVGRPKLAGHTLVGQAAVLLVLCPALTGWLGAPGAALSIGLVFLGGLALWYTRYLPQLLDAAYGRILLPPLLSAAVGAAAAWTTGGWMRLDVGLANGVVKLAVLSAVYAAALLALDGRQTLADLRTLCRHGFGQQAHTG